MSRVEVPSVRYVTDDPRGRGWYYETEAYIGAELVRVGPFRNADAAARAMRAHVQGPMRHTPSCNYCAGRGSYRDGADISHRCEHCNP